MKIVFITSTKTSLITDVEREHELVYF